ncbi:MAG: hypothetical protein ACM3PY_20710 [Omnitrophica WOR_2 bacterium]
MSTVHASRVASNRAGRRHTLLFYRRTMDRTWKFTLPVSLLLAAWWYWSGREFVPAIPQPLDSLVFFGAVAGILYTAFLLLARNMAYVQARGDHLRLATPFLRLNISYRRIRAVHPVNISEIFTLKKSGWRQRNFLEPFYGKTAVAMELNGYPFSPRLMRIFLSPYMFLQDTTGMLFLVEDWMELSTDIDTRRGRFYGRQNQAPANVGLLSALRKK